VLATRSSVGLCAELVGTDLAEVTGLAGSDDPAAAERDGDVLPGIADDWAAEARAAHRARLVELLDRLAEGPTPPPSRPTRCAGPPPLRAHPTGRAGATAPCCAGLLTPGDRAGAVLAAQEFTARLRGELGVAPGPATRRCWPSCEPVGPEPVARGGAPAQPAVTPGRRAGRR